MNSDVCIYHETIPAINIMLITITPPKFPLTPLYPVPSQVIINLTQLFLTQ